MKDGSAADLAEAIEQLMEGMGNEDAKVNRPAAGAANPAPSAGRPLSRSTGPAQWCRMLQNRAQRRMARTRRRAIATGRDQDATASASATWTRRRCWHGRRSSMNPAETKKTTEGGSRHDHGRSATSSIITGNDPKAVAMAARTGPV